MDASLKEAQLITRCWGLEAKEAMDKAARAEAERDAARHETVMAWLETEAASNARAQVELELCQVQCALTTAKGGRLKVESDLDFVCQALAATMEACRKAEEENGRLTDERLPLLMKLGAIKENLADFQKKKFSEEVSTRDRI